MSIPADLPSHPGRVRTVAFSPGGDLLVVAGHEETTVCDLRTRALVATLPVAADAVAFLPDGASLALSVGGQVRTWRKSPDWTEEKSPPQLSPGGFVATPDGKHVAIIDSAGVQILEAGSWQSVRSFAGARPPLAFSPDGTVLASDTASGLTLWPMDGGAPRLLEDSAGILIPIGENYLRLSQGIVFTSGGSQVVAVQNRASERGVFVLRLWDAHSGRDLGTLPGDPERIEHAGAITALAVSPDGRTLATTSLDHSIRLWDITTRHRLAMLQGHHAEGGRRRIFSGWPAPSLHGRSPRARGEDVVGPARGEKGCADRRHPAARLQSRWENHGCPHPRPGRSLFRSGDEIAPARVRAR